MANVLAMFTVACIVRRVTIRWIKCMAKYGSHKKKFNYRRLIQKRGGGGRSPGYLTRVICVVDLEEIQSTFILKPSCEMTHLKF